MMGKNIVASKCELSILCCFFSVVLVLSNSSAFASTGTPVGPKVISVKTAQAVQVFKAEDYVKAAQLFRELTELNPKDALSWQFLGQSLANIKDVMGAQRAFAKVLEIQPNGPIADSTRDMKAKLPAPDLFTMKIDPGLSLGDWIPLAQEQVKQGKRNAVMEQIKQYLNQFGPVPQLLVFQASLQQEALATINVEDADTAKAALPQIRELMAQTPDNLDVLRLEARACHLVQDFECAEADYFSWLKISADNSPDRKDVVNALMQARQHQAADAFLHVSIIGVNVLSLMPKQAESLGLDKPRGALIQNVEKDGAADKAGIQIGDVILKFDGKDINFSSELPVVASISSGSKVLVQLWREHKNKEINLRVGEISTTELAAINEQAAQAFKEGDYGRAVTLFRELAELTPQDVSVWHFLGQSLGKTKDVLGARRAFARVLEIQPVGPLADSTRELLAKLPEPDLFTMQLDSGITLGDWMKLAEKYRAEGKLQSVLHDISEYLNQFGPVPQLLALQEKLLQEIQAAQEQRLQSAIAAIIMNNAETANNALPQIRQLKSQAPGNLDLMRLEARACHLIQDFSCAEAAYAAWLKSASASDPMRSSMVKALMQARQNESLPPTPMPPPLPLAPAATGEIIRDCKYCPEMVVISKGSFEMGDANSKHTVSFAHPFAIGKTEVTQGQWKEIMGNNPSQFQNCGNSCPVDKVSWDDAKEFIQKLNAKTGKLYRLPSEAEWEAACRAGKEQEYCGSDNVNSVAWYGAYSIPPGNSIKTTHPVATKQANAWGLYDMSGNVWEWVEDNWHDNFNGAPTNGSAWTGVGAKRVVRGGSWVSKPQSARASYRDWDSAADRYYFNGFRLARTLP